jgi:hypothetical protein
MLTGQAATATSGMAQVASYAAVAGAAGTASMAGAPWPLDMGAPEFGMAMAAAAMSFGALASLDTGTNVVPNDMIAQIHAGERIIPAADNRALMSAIGRSFATPGGGDFHFHNAPSLNVSESDFARQLERHSGHLVKLLRNMHRNGQLNFARG